MLITARHAVLPRDNACYVALDRAGRQMQFRSAGPRRRRGRLAAEFPQPVHPLMRRCREALSGGVPPMPNFFKKAKAKPAAFAKWENEMTIAETVALLSRSLGKSAPEGGRFSGCYHPEDSRCSVRG